MSAKDRLTWFFCANATGSFIIPSQLIGKSKSPFCLRAPFCQAVPDGIHYDSQPNAWMTTSLCQKWFDNIFYKVVKNKFPNEKIALVWDNFRGHSINCSDPFIHIYELPPNCTSRHQPLDQGIISVLKQQYRKKMLRRFLAMLDNWDAIYATPAPHGCNRLQNGHLPNILDAMWLVHDAVQALDRQVVILSFFRLLCFRRLLSEIHGISSLVHVSCPLISILTLAYYPMIV